MAVTFCLGFPCSLIVKHLFTSCSVRFVPPLFCQAFGSDGSCFVLFLYLAVALSFAGGVCSNDRGRLRVVGLWEVSVS